ncbi:MAG TPA: protein-export chaperone SecB [Magnetospirillum sp.]|jgi:preprotein translocase subunit SecB|nr:protein-export chaperone SecB [Magnetospirillum sp.]
MSENTELQQLVVNGQYVKDLSFEVPGAPGIYMEMQGQAPNIPIHVDINASKLGDNSYEVVLHLKVEARLEDNRPVFIVELAYGGIFTLNIPAEHLQPMLLIECPRLLFPFARNIIADTTRDGGFPPLMIQPIDFVQLFRARMEAAQAEAAEEGPVGHA